MRLCFGTLAISPIIRKMDVGEATRLLMRAYEQGVRILDTAEYYDNYALLRPALAALPDIKVITKSYAFSAKGAAESLRRAREGLGRNHIDFFLLHEQESEHTLRGHAEATEFYLERKKAGEIGGVGV